jgi:hypothetical protein
MGLNAVGLGPSDQEILRKLQDEIIKTFRNADSIIDAGQCDHLSRIWFGDDTDIWKKKLAKNLNTMASLLNTKPVTIDGVNYRQRHPDFYGWAQPPTGGWQQFLTMSKAEGQNFHINLDSNWDRLPNFRSGPTPDFSKFHGIVHELTHLFLGTDDIDPPYGEYNCKQKAKNNPAQAKNNADNWAFFVDDIRLMPIQPRHVNPPSGPVEAVIFQEWYDKTMRGGLHSRSNDLDKVDKALAAFQRLSSPGNRLALVQAFKNWYQRNPKERTSRNKDNIVERLRDYINFLQ